MDSQKRIKMKKMAEISQVRMFVACAKSSTHINAILSDSRKRIKTLVWTRIDRCVFIANENAYFWKRISVDRVLLRKVIDSRLGFQKSHPES